MSESKYVDGVIKPYTKSVVRILEIDGVLWK